MTQNNYDAKNTKNLRIFGYFCSRMAKAKSSGTAVHANRNGKHILLKALTAAAALLSVMCFLSSFISPAKAVIFHYFGLAAIGIMVADASLLVIWTIKMDRWLLFPAASLLLNLGFISSMVHFGEAPHEDIPYDLRICTFNVCGFALADGMSSMAAFANAESMDVICVQETGDASKLEEFRKAAGFPYSTFYGKVGIVSKHPIEETHNKLIANSSREILCADLDISGKKVRIITTHLQTTGVSAVRLRLQKDEYTTIQGAENSIRYNLRKRAEQADNLNDIISETPKDMPLIVCGDFNDTPASYTYRRVKGRLSDGFKACGHGYGSTFFGLRGIYRIDYIFYNKRLAGTRYDVSDVELSDHKAVMMNLRFVE